MATPEARSEADLSIPGPVDREDFADAQRRHRRARRWYAATSAMAMLLMGIPLAVVITPLLVLFAVLGADLLNLVTPTSDLTELFDSDGSGSTTVTPLLVVGIAGAVLVPGLVVHLATWVSVRRLFARAGSGAALTLGARDPRPGELEERQLVNVVEEMAIACGVPAPKVQLIDSEVANAAVVGPDLEDATLVVTTGLLATLGRDETQAVLAHAIGSAGNGDLVIGTTIATVEQTTGTVATLLSMPTSAEARGVAGKLVRHVTRPGRDQARAASELAVVLASTEMAEDDEGRSSRVLRVVLLPVSLAGGVYSLARSFYSSLFVDPVLRRGWRARKRLADATAVELTRNPDALARGLGELAARGDLLPGTAWASHLFVVGPEAAMAKSTAVLHERVKATGGGRAALGIFGDREAMAAFAELAEVAEASTYHPPLGDRVEALHRLGATEASTAWAPPASRRRSKVLAVLFAPFRLFAFLFQAFVPLFALAVALFLGLIYVLPVTAGLHQLLR